MEHSVMVDVELTEWKCFPTNIYTFKSIKDVSQEHENMIVDAKNNILKNKVGYTRMGLFQTGDDLHNLPTFRKFSIFVSQLCADIFYKEGYEKQKIEITQMWANQQDNGSVHPPHGHSNCILSGVYYIKAAENSGNIVFNDPRSTSHMAMPVRKKGEPPKHLWREVRVNPMVGRIIMFPAWLWHCVDPNNTNDIRISVSFNFLQKGMFI